MYYLYDCEVFTDDVMYYLYDCEAFTDDVMYYLYDCEAFTDETGYWTRAIKRFALFDLLKSLYSDTNILSKYIPSLQKKL